MVTFATIFEFTWFSMAQQDALRRKMLFCRPSLGLHVRPQSAQRQPVAGSGFKDDRSRMLSTQGLRCASLPSYPCACRHLQIHGAYSNMRCRT